MIDNTLRMASLLAPALAVAMVLTAPATAQEAPNAAAGSPAGLDASPLAFERDYREDMRRLVEAVADYARQQRPDFVVVAQNGLELLAKAMSEDPDAEDGSRLVPARRYIRVLDGILVEGLHFGVPEIDKPPPKDAGPRRMALAEIARANGLRVLSLDYGRRSQTALGAYRASRSRGFVSFTAVGAGAANNRLPAYPRRPFAENPRNVVSLKDVGNFAYLRDSAGFGREDQFALTLHGTNYDLVVVEPFHGRRPLSRRAVETMKYKKLGSRRLVLAYVDIGTVASYLYYWNDDWAVGSPSWIVAPITADPDRFYVSYWHPEWRKLMTGHAGAFIHGVAVDQGFDGVVLAGLDVYQVFESGGAPSADQITQ